VYVGDLYTTRPVTSLDDLIAAPGPKRLSMTFLREINSADFGKLLTRGMEDNVSKQELSKIIPGMIKMGDIFAANKSFAPGDVCSLEWDPAKGLSVYAKGKLQAEPFKDPAFYRALMSIWFGNTPADWKLKDELLGIKPTATVTRACCALTEPCPKARFYAWPPVRLSDGIKDCANNPATRPAPPGS
jgi:hypothetical protein